MDRFAIYSFAKLWVPAGTRTNLAAVGKFCFSPAWREELGVSADISEYFWWIVGFLGRVFQVHIFLGDENVFEKIGPEWIPSHSPTYLV